MLAEALPELAGWEICILATDINREALNKTQEGLYGRWSFREVPMDVIKRNFTRKGDKYLIKQKFKDMVTFKYLNLVEDGYPSLATNTAEIDLILCRNVIIYFDPENKRRVIQTFYEKTRPGGHLLLGHSESLINLSNSFELRHLRNDLVYRRPLIGSPVPDRWHVAASAAISASSPKEDTE